MEKPKAPGFELPPVGASLPIERKLTDKQGRELDAQIIGKNRTHLTVIRKLDQQQFDLEIANLSLADQDFVLGLPDQRPPAPTSQQNYRNPETSRSEARISYLEKTISRREREIEELGAKTSDPTLEKYTSPKKRGYITQIKKLQAELIDLNLELERLQGIEP